MDCGRFFRIRSQRILCDPRFARFRSEPVCHWARCLRRWRRKNRAVFNLWGVMLIGTGSSSTRTVLPLIFSEDVGRRRLVLPDFASCSTRLDSRAAICFIQFSVERARLARVAGSPRQEPRITTASAAGATTTPPQPETTFGLSRLVFRKGCSSRSVT